MVRPPVAFKYFLGIPAVSCRGGKKKPAQWRANEGMVVLYPFGCTNDCGGIHTAKYAGKILRKLDAVL